MNHSDELLVIHSLYDNEGFITKGTYVIITVTHRASQELLQFTYSRIKMPKDGPVLCDSRRIRTKELQLFFIPQDSIQAILGMDRIDGYAIQRGVENAPRISAELETRFRG